MTQNKYFTYNESYMLKRFIDDAIGNKKKALHHLQQNIRQHIHTGTGSVKNWFGKPQPSLSFSVFSEHILFSELFSWIQFTIDRFDPSVAFS